MPAWAGRHLRLLRRGQAVPVVVLPDRWPGRPRRHGGRQPGLQRLEESRGAEGRRPELASARQCGDRRHEPAADRDGKRSHRVALVRRDRPPSAIARERRRARRAVPTCGRPILRLEAPCAPALRVRALPRRWAGAWRPDARRPARTGPAARTTPLEIHRGRTASDPTWRPSPPSRLDERCPISVPATARQLWAAMSALPALLQVVPGLTAGLRGSAMQPSSWP